MNPRSALLAAMLAAGALLGCSILPPQAPRPALHDFGPLPASSGGSSGQIRVDRVTAPPWIDDGMVHYRLVYKDPTSLLGYADHRWAAAPSSMLALKLEYLLAGAPAPAGSSPPVRVLSVDLLEFEQDFSSSQQAEVKLVAEAVLRRALDGKVLQQKQFVLSAATAPDVRGAVTDLAKLAQQAAAEIVAWSGEDSGAATHAAPD